MLKTESISLEEVLTIWLPGRIEAVKNATWALELQTRVHGSAAIHASIDGQVHIKGNVALFAGPIIEIGFVHARALLEFLGLGARYGKLAQVTRRKPTDLAIEHYSVRGRQLDMVKPYEVFAVINMPKPVVEWALVGVIETTNKLLAHVTTGEVLAMAMYGQIQVVLEAIPALLHSHLYERLDSNNEIGIQFNRWEETNRSDK
jgi:hypothetical protein